MHLKIMMLSWHGNNFLAFFVGNLLVSSVFVSQRAHNAEFDVLFAFHDEQAVKQMVHLPVIR